jgi:hypothetical protein
VKTQEQTAGRGIKMSARNISNEPRTLEAARHVDGRSLTDLSVGEFLTLLRDGGTVNTSALTGADSPDTPSTSAIADRNLRVGSERATLERLVSLIGPSPVDIQIAFLQRLSERPEEMRAFMDNPPRYSIEHGVLLDPAIVRTMVDTVLFGDPVTDRTVERLGSTAARELVSFGNPGSPAAWPAAVSAVAAVVSAAAAVVSAVAASTKHSANDLIALKGLGPRGVTLPGSEPMDLTRSDLLPSSSSIPVAGSATSPVSPGSLGRGRGAIT